MFALMNSMRTHYEIPSTFDGEMPDLAFGEAGEPPRLQFGRWYLVPLPDGREVPGRLYDGIVLESEKLAYGCYQHTEDILTRSSARSGNRRAAGTRWSNSAISSTRAIRIRRGKRRLNGWPGHPITSV
jgi:hypothetical protein